MSVREGLSVLRERNFRTFYLGYASSLLGTSMSAVAVAFGVLAVSGSATDLGLVLAAGVLPQVVFLMIGGVTADRFGRRPTMLVADVVRSCSQGTFAVLLLTGQPHIWLFAVLSAVRGTGEAFFNPGLRALAVETTPAARWSDANALLGLARSTARVAGPALGGVLVALTSPGVVLGIDAGTYAISVLALTALRLGKVVGGQRKSFRHDMREGWHEFRSRSWLTANTVQFMVINLLAWGPFLVLGPLLAHERLGGAGTWGVIMSAYGAGSILGGLLALGRRPRRPLITATVATFGYALPCASVALALPLPLLAGCALLAGIGSSTALVFSDTVTQQQVPTAALARVATFQLFGSYSLGPLAFALAGPVAGVVGPAPILLFGAGCAVLSAVAVLAVPAVRAMPFGRIGDMGQPTLHTERLTLVPLADEHLELEVELDADPEVMRYLTNSGRTRAQVEEVHGRRLKQARDGLGMWIGLAEDGFVGLWMLQAPHGPDQPDVEGEADLGYRLLRGRWRQGYATEGSRELLRYGFEDLGLTRIFAQTLTINEPSRATMSKLGLTFVRQFPSSEVGDDDAPLGVEHGEVEYEITRTTWDQGRASRAIV